MNYRGPAITGDELRKAIATIVNEMEREKVRDPDKAGLSKREILGGLSVWSRLYWYHRVYEGLLLEARECSPDQYLKSLLPKLEH